MGSETLSQALSAETDKLLDCVHCGFCLSSCPTYVHLGDENDSPRGRLYLMRAVAEGRLQPTSEAFTEHIDLCLGCRACETVCPAGVNYGSLLEAARADIVTFGGNPKSLFERALRLVLNRVFTSAALLHCLFIPARALRRIRFVRHLDRARYLPLKLRKALALLNATRPVDLRGSALGSNAKTDDVLTYPLKQRANDSGSRCVALFAGCVARELFEHTNLATINVLERNGCQVVDPGDQQCCGALHAHAGELETARMLARKNIEAFGKLGCEAVIVNVAGCGALLKEYGKLLADDLDYHQRAQLFAARVRDISEYLVEIGFQPGLKPVNLKVTYDAPCHLHHAQRITKAPLEVINRIPGVNFIPLAEAETCCGSAGIYNLAHPELADQILAPKLEKIRDTRAEVLLTGNAGCLMHLTSGAQRAGLRIQVLHLIELVALTYD